MVIRSFNGPAVIQFDSAGGFPGECLRIDRAYVKLIGIKLLNCTTGIHSTNQDGDLSLDSITIENSIQAINFQQIRGKVTLRHIAMKNILDVPPWFFSKVDSLDTLGSLETH